MNDEWIRDSRQRVTDLKTILPGSSFQQVDSFCETSNLFIASSLAGWSVVSIHSFNIFPLYTPIFSR